MENEKTKLLRKRHFPKMNFLKIIGENFSIFFNPFVIQQKKRIKISFSKINKKKYIFAIFQVFEYQK
jgi:hypothetical protein